MKIKSFLCFFGGTLIVGTIALVATMVLEKTFVKHAEKIVNKNNFGNEISNYQTDSNFSNKSLKDVKFDTANSISERHKNAAIVIKNSLQHMSDDTENNLNRNDNDFETMYNNLEILSK